VSSAEKAAQVLTQLEKLDLRILQAIEMRMTQHEYVPFEEVARYSSLHNSELEYRLKNLDRLDLIYRQKEPYLGYIMNYTAYDCLALNALVKSGTLEALGPSVGIGKEADVYEAVTPSEVKVAVKFHRLGRTSFRDTRRKRDYIADRRHISWLYQSRLAAENEYRALKMMYDAGVSVPQPHDQNRHTIVMEYLKAMQLSEIIEIDEPGEILIDILDNVGLAFRAGVIHTDLSEYNVMINPEGRVWIIDWPQYTASDHPNAEEILARDVGNVAYYFQRKYNTSMTVEEAIEYVKERASLPASS
jgi:RIO kinase 2